MNNLIPNAFDINGNLVISLEKDSLIALAVMIIAVVAIILFMQRIIAKS